MVFSGAVFLRLFLPAALLLYYASLPVSRRVWPATTACVLTVVSYVFYGWSRPEYAWLMFASSLLDYVAGRGVVAAQARGGRGTPWLVASLVGNLGLLGYFKYANLFVRTWNDAAVATGRPEAAVPWTEVVLPVGISFYTFQTMSYTIDLWRRETTPARSFWDFMAYVSMFPQLVAGPIVRYRDVAEQLAERRHTFDGFFRGVVLLQIGLVKKALLADPLAALADQAFGAGRGGAAPELCVGDAWLGALAFTFQIYFDFSGYSDMAIGLGRMLGFRFPINFDAPYRAASITEFWRRWHVSLSTWLRDYLYVALGGNRRGAARTYVNLALTMLLGGLWHGAQWTFVVWGAYQGLLLVVERAAGRRPLYAALPSVVRVGLTFVLVVVGWVFFKAPSVAAAFAHLGAMCGAGAGRPPLLDVNVGLHGTVLLLGAAAAWFGPTSQALADRAPTGRLLLLQPAFLAALAHLDYESVVPFLYFRF